MIACLVTAIVQTPILFCVSALLDGDDHWSPYVVVLFLSGLQFIAISFYFCARGLKPCQVKSGSWRLLMFRSVLYCFAINMFVYSLERLNPASAMMALHSGIIATTAIIRAFCREQMFFTLTVIKVC
jgi:drug/metabolite transporter (DMT)-like permease